MVTADAPRACTTYVSALKKSRRVRLPQGDSEPSSAGQSSTKYQRLRKYAPGAPRSSKDTHTVFRRKRLLRARKIVHPAPPQPPENLFTWRASLTSSTVMPTASTSLRFSSQACSAEFVSKVPRVEMDAQSELHPAARTTNRTAQRASGRLRVVRKVGRSTLGIRRLIPLQRRGQ